MNVNMMLSHPYKEEKVKFPCYVSRKYDGVPVIFWVENGKVYHKTRQGKELQSIPHIIEQVQLWYDNQNKQFDGFFCCGELYIEGMAFKDISGKARKQEPCDELQLYIFEKSLYLDWYDWISVIAYSTLESTLKFIRQERCEDLTELQSHLDMLNVTDKDWEGLIIRSGEYIWNVERSKRSWNSMKFKKEPTVDLRVVGLEEAISKEGEPLGRVGAFLCEYGDAVIRVGSGKLTHKTSQKLWETELLQYGRIIEVKYMKDDSYGALRQPTFQRFRDDKVEPNEERGED